MLGTRNGQSWMSLFLLEGKPKSCARVWLQNPSSSTFFCFTSIDLCPTSFSGEATRIKHSSHSRTLSSDPCQPSGFPILVSPKPDEAWSGLQDHTDRVTSLCTEQTGQSCNVPERDSLQNKCSARTTTDSVLEMSTLWILIQAEWESSSINRSRTLACAATWQLFQKESSKIYHLENIRVLWKIHWVSA